MYQTRLTSQYIVDTFSDNLVCGQTERVNLEKKYSKLLEVTDKFNRQLVSYQGNKAEALHDWLKYKEGFSASLVKKFIDELKIHPGDTILDPFMGSGTTSLVSQINGINSIGFDILPTSKIAFDVKINAVKYDTQILENILHEIRGLKLPNTYHTKFSHLYITQGAFPEDTEAHIVFLTDWVKKSGYTEKVKELLLFLIMTSLEEISYTRKDGQYLRWDYRSSKVINYNKKRIAMDKPPLKTKLDKGDLLKLKDVLERRLSKTINDIRQFKETISTSAESKHELILGSVLFELPKYGADKIDAVITSPPYCNRYDYTRTYALELVYLGLNDIQIRDLRQTLLTSTVENKSKIPQLREYYAKLGAENRFNEVTTAINNNAALREVLSALHTRNSRGEINNKGVIRMVEGYFTELAFVFRELHRVCKPGAHVVFINDNVRYAGEIIPVDFISTELAEQFGFKPVKVYVLPQTKGNSSQQMKKFGQVRLRKSITVWEK